MRDLIHQPIRASPDLDDTHDANLRTDNLAPDIQEEILFLPRTTHGRDTIKEADLRPIAKTLDWNKQ